ncbi:von Willebrand factor type A domain-containing protein [Azospirillum baldaniorum]|uniref:VWA domain-containing protein n=2 Tax=Azospirillum baldaniorum TaxID=1064539 RepID=UPI0011A05079|nr:VWA domain-containing protein [Azospirillum baldaniorum]TWA66296.1 von Willebrand factor type A domain-containing protein [Azospirillum baldaniorum]
MADTRITTTDSSGTRRLGLHGQLAVSMHRQLATILGNRLGPQHARYFARPVLNPNGGRIDWYAPLAGTVRPLTALPAGEAERLAAQARQIESDIAQLAAKLKAEGQSAELVGRMLELALITPGQPLPHLYEIGGQPVLTLWGHEAEGAMGLSDASAPSGPTPATPSAADATGAPSERPDSPATRTPDAAGTRITSTGPSGTRRLELEGQPAVSMHRQLATIVGNRLGPRHARYFARPVLAPDGSRIDWHAPLSGTARPLTALPAGEAERLAAQARQIESDIAQLAAKLKAEGQPDERLGRMLEQALVTPGPSRAHLYEVGGQPVLTQWGHEAEGAARPGGAGAPSSIPESARAGSVRPTLSPAAEAGALGATAGTPARRTLRGWLTWLLPLLLALLLLFLLLRACEPLPPVVVEVPGAVPAAPAGNGDSLAALESEEQALRAKLAELNRSRAEELAQCGPVPPAVQPPRVELSPPPAAPTPAPSSPDIAAPAPAAPEAAPPPPPPPPKPKPQAAQAPPAEPKPQQPPKSCNPTFAPGDEPEVVLIVDGSKSMDERHLGPQTRMDLARRSIEHMVRGLPKPVEVALVEFTTCTDVRRDKFYSAPERDALVREVQRLTPTGGTPLARSLERAGNIVSSDAEATIIVVSDGDDTCHGDPCAAARAIKARKPRVTINVIDLSDQSGRATVQCIAKATGGKVLSPNSGADMLQKMQQATRQPDVRQCGP